MLRGRLIPVAPAWLGVVASVFLMIVVPIEHGSFLSKLTWAIWLPMLVFEIVFAVRPLTKGVAERSA